VEQLTEEAYGGQTFQPQLCEKSRRLASQRTLGDLQDARPRAALHAAVASEAARDFEESYPFKPNLTTTSNANATMGVVSAYAVDGNGRSSAITQGIARQRRDAESKQQRARRQQQVGSITFVSVNHFNLPRLCYQTLIFYSSLPSFLFSQYEALKECTFEPWLATRAKSRKKKARSGSVTEDGGDVSADGQVVVAGADKFLERAARKKQMKREQKQREDDAFGFGTAASKVALSRDGFTVPEPFALSADTGAGDARRQRLSRTAQEARDAELTFKPRTLAGEQRQLLQAILAESDDDDDDGEFDASEFESYVQRGEFTASRDASFSA
jgi:hypothetical protein